MSTMIERVEEAIRAAIKNSVDGEVWGFEDAARAAIEAMREPTPAMVSANSDASGPDDQQTIDDWNAMIDAALNETQAPPASLNEKE